ncbi:MAG: tetratricopeptide repeat protein [Armatimonadetes bacterium]|nr:tetratricopeptide repeat protein [Armatimonadota bacterium]
MIVRQSAGTGPAATKTLCDLPASRSRLREAAALCSGLTFLITLPPLGTNSLTAFTLRDDLLYTEFSMGNLQKKWIKQQVARQSAGPPPPPSGHPLAAAIQAFQAGRHEEAIRQSMARLESEPYDMDARELIGICHTALRQFEVAEQVFGEMLELNSLHFPAVIGLARTKAALGKTAECLELLEQGAEMAGSDFGALSRVAGAYAGIGEMDQALLLFEKLDRIRPNDPEILFKKAQALVGLKRFDEAVRIYQRVQSLRPDLPITYANLAGIWAEKGLYEQAKKQCETAARLGGSQHPGLRFLNARVAPVILESQEQIEHVRSRMFSDYEALRRSGAKLRDPFAEVGAMHSLPTYQGVPSRQLQEAISRAYLAVCPELAWEAESLQQRKPRSEQKIRVGVCSAFMWDHTIAHVMSGLFRKLDRSRFDVILFRVGRPSDPVQEALEGVADRVVLLEGHLAHSREAIAEAELDLLLFTDFGAEPLTSFLSYSRLAPVQVLLWGFPDTSGVPNVDYFLSTSAFEPEGAEEHYSETLIQLPRLYTYIDPPTLSPSSVSKRDLGVPEESHLYLCAQSLPKVHPEFDIALKGILEADPKAHLLFFEGLHPEWGDLLRNRFRRSLGTLAERVRFSPRLDRSAFQGALQAADTVIDTKHFTGGFTTYLCFALGVPVVTWNGSLMRGRMTSGLYRMMGLEPLAADTDEEFVALAARSATDRPFREDWSAQVAANSGKLFHDEGSVRDFERFLTAAHRAHLAGKKLESWEDVQATPTS